MKKNKINKLLILSTLLFIFALGSYAYAGYGCPGRGAGNGKAGHGCPVSGDQNSLSDEDYESLQTLKKNYFEDTKELRESISEKQEELNSEFEASAPDTDKITTVQKEISALRAKLDEKYILFKLEAKKIVPEIGTGRGYKHGGHGRYGRGCGN